MVEQQHDDVVVGSQLHHGGPEGRFGGEVERPPDRGVHEGGHLVLGGAQVFHDGGGQCGGQDPLVRLPVALGEQRPQCLVTVRHVGEGGPPGLPVEGAAQSHDQGEVVRGGGALDLLDDPEPLLGVRERQFGGAFGSDERRAGGAAGGGRACHEFGDGGRLEEVADRQLGLERGTGAADEPGGEERVPAEVEEVAVDADAALGEAEDLREEAAQGLLARGAGARPVPVPVRSGAGRALTSSLPLTVSGRVGTVTRAEGTM